MIIIAEAVVVLALVAWVMWVLVGALQARIGTAGEITAREEDPSRARADQEVVAEARRAGEEDMRTAWLRWQLRPVPDQAEQRDVSLIPRTLAVVPKADWDVDRLRQHGRSVWALRAGARRHDQLPEVDARLDRVAAMISDLTDDEFDTGLGQTSDRYLFHREREVRLAYLEGGGRGVEVIMDTVTATRAQIRQDAATRAAAESLVQQRNAALRALRETHRPTETRDAHAAWEAKAEEIDE
jgi:hypothetical protein